MATKSVTKRIKLVKSGTGAKRRRMGQGHFRANKSGNQITKKRSEKKVSSSDVKNIKAYAVRLGGNNKN